MEEKKVTKISLLTFFLILAIIVIIMGIFMYKFYNEKTEANEKSAELQINSLKGTASESQGKIEFTDEQVKTALSNFLELRAHANCSTLIENLEKKGKVNYDSSKDTSLNDGTVLTTIKFSDYKNAMLNYVSENEFENNWISAQGFKKSDSGYLIRSQGGGGLAVYTIKSITKIDDLTYSAKTTYIVDNDESMKFDEDFIFSVKSYNSDCVIDSIK